MTVHDPAKLILFSIILIIGGVVLAVGAITHDPATMAVGGPIVTGVLGYLTGNGRIAAKGKANQPTFAPARRKTNKGPAARREIPTRDDDAA